MSFSVKIDSSGLNRAIALARGYSRRTAALAANTASYFILKRVSVKTPKASQSAIDARLGVTATVRTTSLASGKRFGTPLKRPRTTYGLTGNPSRAEMMIVARMWPGSKTNKRENNRWAINRASFSSGGRKNFWSKVKAVALRMVKGKHSSIGFLKSAMIPAIRALEQHIDPKYRRGSGTIDPSAVKAARRSKTPKAWVQPAREKAVTRCVTSIEIGVANSLLSPRHNAAMHQYVKPVLEQETKNEESNQYAYALRKMDELKAKMRSVGAVA